MRSGVLVASEHIMARFGSHPPRQAHAVTRSQFPKLIESLSLMCTTLHCAPSTTRSAPRPLRTCLRRPLDRRHPDFESKLPSLREGVSSYAKWVRLSLSICPPQRHSRQPSAACAHTPDLCTCAASTRPTYHVAATLALLCSTNACYGVNAPVWNHATLTGVWLSAVRLHLKQTTSQHRQQNIACCSC